MIAILSDREEIIKKKEMEQAQAVINEIYMDYKFFISHPVKILFFLSLYRRIFFLPICMKEERGFFIC